MDKAIQSRQQIIEGEVTYIHIPPGQEELDQPHTMQQRGEILAIQDELEIIRSKQNTHLLPMLLCGTLGAAMMITMSVLTLVGAPLFIYGVYHFTMYASIGSEGDKLEKKLQSIRGW